MKLRKRELAEARAELRGAALWYEDRRPGLGDEFLDAVDRAIEDIDNFPDAWAPYPGWDREPVLRTKRVPRFPYRVVYLVKGGDLVIFAYPHDKQLPGYWTDRLGT